MIRSSIDMKTMLRAAMAAATATAIATATATTIATTIGLPIAAAATPPERGLAAATPVVSRRVEPASARHSIMIGESRIDYTVRWSELVLTDASDRAQATISSTSYQREGAPHQKNRPIIVFFNGGPGASSSPLHFDAFGPRQRVKRNTAADAALSDNPASPIDVADLLFVDPVGTGFSRELIVDGGKAYWSPRGDAEAVLKLIRHWLRENDRTASPLIIVGQSYGGTRAALMAREVGDLNVAAMVLVSPALDYSAGAAAPGNDNAFVFDFPTMAVAAWHHGKVSRVDHDIESVWSRARDFALNDYLRALALGSRLPETDKTQIARRMSMMIGLSAEEIQRANLRITSQNFLERLLATENQLVGRLDTRVAAPVKKPLNSMRPAAANDPSLGLGRDNVIRSPAIANYYREEVGVHTDREYFSLTLDVNFNWNWSEVLTGAAGSSRFWFTTTPHLSHLMREKTQTKLLVIGGYFDLATPLLGVEHAITHANLPMDRVELLALPGSHSPYDDPRDLAVVAARLRALAQAATPLVTAKDR